MRSVESVSSPKKFSEVFQENWFQESSKIARAVDFAPFHWELEFPEVYFGLAGKYDNPGFDAIVGNPPYDILSEEESGRDLTNLRAFVEYEPVYQPAKRGKNNLYKLFICRALEYLKDGGYFGFIVPMGVLGDDYSAEIRRKFVQVGHFTGIEAFPQKDSVAKRVFPEAKLSTAVFAFQRDSSPEAKSYRFGSRVHPGREIKTDSPSLALSTEEIPLYDPNNLTIVSCSQADWDLATRIMSTGRLSRLGEFAESFQGEVNETNDRKAKRISYDDSVGPEVVRGAHVTLYSVREASQGNSVFLDVDAFLNRGGRRPMPEDSKAFHHRYKRIGFQRKSPQNNFRRLIAAPIRANTFLLESVSYVPEHKSQLPLSFILAVLNSKLSEWYFRLGSTNAMVSEYQFKILPCPIFRAQNQNDLDIEDDVLEALDNGDTSLVLKLLAPVLAEEFNSPLIAKVIIKATNRIVAIEDRRTMTSRNDRSSLSTDAQMFQDLVDTLFYRIAGLTAAEAEGLEQRLERML